MVRLCVEAEMAAVITGDVRHKKEREITKAGAAAPSWLLPHGHTQTSHTLAGVHHMGFSDSFQKPQTVQEQLLSQGKKN